jgi:hypothetical protein
MAVGSDMTQAWLRRCEVTVARTSLCVMLALLIAAVTVVVEGQDFGAFHAGIDIVSLNVSVTSSDQRCVSDLVQSDFTVLENDVPQPIRYFAKTGPALDGTAPRYERQHKGCTSDRARSGERFRAASLR